MSTKTLIAIEKARVEYLTHLQQAGKASYPLRYALHVLIAYELGRLEHCRHATEINSLFDSLEVLCGVSQKDWHGCQPGRIEMLEQRMARLESQMDGAYIQMLDIDKKINETITGTIDLLKSNGLST